VLGTLPFVPDADVIPPPSLAGLAARYLDVPAIFAAAR
jgi:hypothetical protein